MVVPAATPLTTPVLLTVATAGLLLLHVPPEAVSVSELVAVTQTVAEPEMEPAWGSGRTVSVSSAERLPQAFVLV